MSEVVEVVESDISLTGELRTHKNIHTNHSYNLIELSENYAKISIKAKNSESVDDKNTIYDGSIFSAANFCAMAAINDEDSFLISANIDFLNQITKDDEDIIFEAKARVNTSGKKQIEVSGKINDISVFYGDFVTIKLDAKSVIKTKKKEDIK